MKGISLALVLPLLVSLSASQSCVSDNDCNSSSDDSYCCGTQYCISSSNSLSTTSDTCVSASESGAEPYSQPDGSSCTSYCYTTGTYCHIDSDCSSYGDNYVCALFYSWEDGTAYGTYCVNQDSVGGTIYDVGSGGLYYAAQLTSDQYTCANDLDCEVWELSTGQNIDFCCGAVNATSSENSQIGQINFCLNKDQNNVQKKNSPYKMDIECIGVNSSFKLGMGALASFSALLLGYIA